MSIRKRLAQFIILMVSLLIIMGGILLLVGPTVVGAFRQSFESLDQLNLIRELKFNVNRQKTSLNRYLMLDDQGELLSFQESQRLGGEQLNYVEKKYQHTLPYWYKDVGILYSECSKIAAKIISQYQNNQKTRAFESWSSDLYPSLQKLSQLIDNIETEKSQHARVMIQRVEEGSHLIGWAVFGFFLFAIIVGMFRFRSLYRAVMQPLSVLKEGAEKFGKGHLEHRIELSMDNEFGALSESFNKMAENIYQLQLQAVHMDRMSAVGQLAGGVAHEINNPLTAVLGQTQILLAKCDAGNPHIESLKKIENAALRCRKIVRGLLDFSRPGQINFESLDINNVLNATIELCEADLKKSRISVEKRFQSKLPFVKGNVTELQQVLLNLINNAIQAMPHGGTLTLETRTVRESSIAESKRGDSSGPGSDGSWVELIVKDSGVGIPEEHLSRIFEPFFTTKDIGKGTGLGLSISMGIIKKHHGELLVDTPGLNKGAVFTIRLKAK